MLCHQFDCSTFISALAFYACRLFDPEEQRSNPAEQDGIIGITASSAALVVAQQAADFALTTDHLSGARVSMTRLQRLQSCG